MIKEWIKHKVEIPVLSRVQVRAFDAWAINELGVPGVVLMENAGANCSTVVMDLMQSQGIARAVVFCGAGNNGGDGYVIARHLSNAGYAVRVVVCAKPERIQGDAKINLDIIKRMELEIIILDLDEPDIFHKAAYVCNGYGLIVDALLGTGMRGQLREPMAELIVSLNTQKKQTVAVDIPSGLDCDTGCPLPVCVKADCTVTFAAMKKGMAMNAESRQVTGKVFVADIGVPARAVGELG